MKTRANDLIELGDSANMSIKELKSICESFPNCDKILAVQGAAPKEQCLKRRGCIGTHNGTWIKTGIPHFLFVFMLCIFRLV